MNKDEQKTNYTVKTTPNKIISKFNYEQKANYTVKTIPNKIISSFIETIVFSSFSSSIKYFFIF